MSIDISKEKREKLISKIKAIRDYIVAALSKYCFFS